MAITRTRINGVLTFLLPCLLIPSVVCADWHVWTVSDTRHVLRNALPEGGLAVELGAARNQWVGFQILVRADRPVSGVRVEAGDLSGSDAAALRAADARLYRQHQFSLQTGSARNTSFQPDWYPDALIPFQHPTTGQALTAARFRAMPFDLPANETHGFWVDLYVPAKAAPGKYQGVYRLTAGEKRLEIPVSLTVWNFTLPQTPTLATEFGAPARSLRNYYRQQAKAGKGRELADWPAVEAQCAQLLSDHGFNATPSENFRPQAQPNGSYQISASQVRDLQQFVDRYHVNALRIPHPSTVIKDPDAQRDKLQAWLAAFDRAAKDLARPGVVFYVYLRDEPNKLEDYRYVQKWGRAIRQAKSVVQVLVVEQTWTEPGKGGADSAWGDLYGAVDIWCPLFPMCRPESDVKRQQLGETIWTYTALCQGTPPTPWWQIDCPLLNYRVPAWMAWRDGMTGLLYWSMTAGRSRTDDPWVDAPFFAGRGVLQQGRKGSIYYGEGTLLYPADAVGYDGIVPSLRLKALRDAVADYEYLAMLARLGKSEQAHQVVRSVTESWFQWEKDATAYDKARAKLAALIVASSQPRPTQP